jgi:hypothetical protein
MKTKNIILASVALTIAGAVLCDCRIHITGIIVISLGVCGLIVAPMLADVTQGEDHK